MEYSAIVLCAGSGTRANLGYNKIFYKHQGKPLFYYAIESFLFDENCTQLIVVTKREEKEHVVEVLEGLRQLEKIQYVSGGKERSDSVQNAIAEVCNEYVFIHDAARCGVDKKDLDKLGRALKENDAALLGLPIVDTVKRVVNGNVVGTEDRSTLFLAQTPQVFRLEMLKSAFAKAKKDKYVITDEVMLIERYFDAKIAMLEGSKKYNKWTMESDFGGSNV